MTIFSSTFPFCAAKPGCQAHPANEILTLVMENYPAISDYVIRQRRALMNYIHYLAAQAITLSDAARVDRSSSPGVFHQRKSYSILTVRDNPSHGLGDRICAARYHGLGEISGRDPALTHRAIYFRPLSRAFDPQ